MATESVVYVDSSALAKLLVQEPETRALSLYLRDRRLTTSELAIVEVSRVERLAEPERETGATALRLLAEVDLIALSRPLLERAAELTSRRVRSLDAIHLASALATDPNAFVAYDRRLLDAATEAGLTVARPAP